GVVVCFFFERRRRHTRLVSDWSSDVCSSDLPRPASSATCSSTPRTNRPTTCTAAARARSTAASAFPAWSSRAPRATPRNPYRERSEERRVGKEWRGRWGPYDERKERRGETRT